jgi:hypothetical protein
LGSCLSRFAAASVVLLVAAYILCGVQPAKRHDVRPAMVASKTYADSGSGRARMLRPSRMQMRLPREARREPIGSWHPAPYSGLVPFLLRKHNPRDPPRA